MHAKSIGGSRRRMPTSNSQCGEKKSSLIFGTLHLQKFSSIKAFVQANSRISCCPTRTSFVLRIFSSLEELVSAVAKEGSLGSIVVASPASAGIRYHARGATTWRRVGFTVFVSIRGFRVRCIVSIGCYDCVYLVTYMHVKFFSEQGSTFPKPLPLY